MLTHAEKRWCAEPAQANMGAAAGFGPFGAKSDRVYNGPRCHESAINFQHVLF